MARLVLSGATSHGPMLALEPPMWQARVRDEVANPARCINTLDGRFVSYAELLAERGELHSADITLEAFEAKARRCQSILDRFAADLAAAAPDVVILLGNDQDELFEAANVPLLAVYTGDTVRMHPRDTSGMPDWRVAVTRGFGMDSARTYPGHPEVAHAVLKRLVARDFDVALAADVPDPSRLGFGHAFGFVAERLFGGKPPPIVPVLVNTFTPDHPITPRRALMLGRALREVIAELPADLTVAVVASGGLSHFVCEEEFDRAFMAQMASGDASPLAELPEAALVGGSAETRTWIVLAGIVEGLAPAWQEYVPIPRTPPGTGQGMGWMIWKEEPRDAVQD